MSDKRAQHQNELQDEELSELILNGRNLIIGTSADFSNTFRPYPINENDAKAQQKQELLLFWDGIKNFGLGLKFLASALVLFMPRLGLSLFYSGSWVNILRNVAKIFLISLLELVNGIGHAARGLTQFVAAPLTWLLKMPLRGILTVARSVLSYVGTAERRASLQLELEVIREKFHEHQQGKNNHLTACGKESDIYRNFLVVAEKYEAAAKKQRTSVNPEDEKLRREAVNKVHDKFYNLKPEQQDKFLLPVLNVYKRYFSLFGSKDPIFNMSDNVEAQAVKLEI